MNEIWKPIAGYEGAYEVSNLGNVRSLNWGRMGVTKNLYLKKHESGYRQVELFKNGKGEMICVHRLVAVAFIDNPDNLPQVNHKDLNKTNNRTENLEWCTASQNCQHYWANTEREKYKRTRHSKHRNTNIAVEQFSKTGDLINTWENCLAVKHKFGFNQTSIFECCEGKRKTAYGFIWRYAS